MKDHSASLIACWPGKSTSTPSGERHPAAYHMLDVAAVAEHLLAHESHLPAPVRDALALLVALHDLGKISEPFRAMLVHGTPQQHGRHWEATECLLEHHDAFLSHLGGTFEETRLPLYTAVAGHHGKPPWREDRAYRALLRACGAQALQDSQELVQAFAALWPQASLTSLNAQQTLALSWWLPGLTATADWIGSNAEWFAPHAPDLPLPAYLDRARSLARDAVHRAGLNASLPSSARLFEFTPRPMQAACAEIALPDGPTLAFIEDETGAGKTESALLLAQRMMLAGKGRGIFFALPTMATANAMFARARDVVARMFSSPPQLSLAHGRAPLSRDWRELREHRAAHEDAPGCVFPAYAGMNRMSTSAGSARPCGAGMWGRKKARSGRAGLLRVDWCYRTRTESPSPARRAAADRLMLSYSALSGVWCAGIGETL